jgi:transposase
MMVGGRYDLTDVEWSVIEPLLPRKWRGVKRVDDQRVLNGIFWVLRIGSPWADIPERYGPPTTCYNRFVRWRKLGVWERIFAAVSTASAGEVQMIDSSSIRVQHAANIKGGPRDGRRPECLSCRLHGALAGWADHQDPRPRR